MTPSITKLSQAGEHLLNKQQQVEWQIVAIDGRDGVPE